MNYLNLGSMIYFGLYLPLDGRAQNYIELFNEAMVTTLAVHTFAFTDFVDD